MSTDLNCHGFPVTTGRAGAGAGYAWLNMSRTDCSFTQRDDKDGSFKVSHLRAHVQKCTNWHANKHPSSLTRTHTHAHTRTHTYTRLGVIDGKRHKGQQSAGLHLDRTRVLLHHLDLGDGADPNWSFPQPLHCNIQYRSANVLKG